MSPNISAVQHDSGVTGVVPQGAMKGKVDLWVKCRCIIQSQTVFYLVQFKCFFPLCNASLYFSPLLYL